MAQNNANQGIINSWSLIAFAKAHGRMQVGEFANKETGEVFKSCIFTDPADSNNKCFVAFSKKLGELTPREIAAMKDTLQVVQRYDEETNKDTYHLCKQGQNAWGDVDLGL